MKKFLPLILFVIGIVVVIGAILFVRSRLGASMGGGGSSSLPEVKLSDRPIASLTPSVDGHWLDLKIDKIKISAASMDYELLYQLPNGTTQGVPGTIALKGQTQIERNLLLGSESSGKYRYDVGVKSGTLTISFRDSQGNLLAKFSTDFSLLSAANTLTTTDGNFSVVFTTAPAGYFVVMQTFGVNANPPSNVSIGPYGLFASSMSVPAGTVTLNGAKNIYRWTGSTWTNNVNGSAFGAGIFIGTN